MELDPVVVIHPEYFRHDGEYSPYSSAGGGLLYDFDEHGLHIHTATGNAYRQNSGVSETVLWVDIEVIDGDGFGKRVLHAIIPKADIPFWDAIREFEDQLSAFRRANQVEYGEKRDYSKFRDKKFKNLILARIMVPFLARTPAALIEVLDVVAKAGESRGLKKAQKSMRDALGVALGVGE